MSEFEALRMKNVEENKVFVSDVAFLTILFLNTNSSY